MEPNSVTKRIPTSHLIFPTIKRVKISVGELIGVRLFEGQEIIGIVTEISKDNKHFFLKVMKEEDAKSCRLCFRLDQVIKLN